MYIFCFYLSTNCFTDSNTHDVSTEQVELLTGDKNKTILFFLIKRRKIIIWKRMTTLKTVFWVLLINFQNSKWLWIVLFVANNSINILWLKMKVRNTLLDQLKQSYYSDVQDSPKCINYRLFKNKYVYKYVLMIYVRFRLHMGNKCFTVWLIQSMNKKNAKN